MTYKTCPTCDGQGHVPDSPAKVWFTIDTEYKILAFASESEALRSDYRFAFCDEESLRVILEENPKLADDLFVFNHIIQTLDPWEIWCNIQPLAEAIR